MRLALLLSLILLGCAGLAPRSDDEVLGKRGFVVVKSIRDVPNSDMRTLYNVTVQNDSLKMTARFGGGCKPHAFTLYVARESETNVSLYVQHDANNDTCPSLYDDYPLAFDLKYLKTDLGLQGRIQLVSHPGEIQPFSVSYP